MPSTSQFDRADVSSFNGFHDAASGASEEAAGGCLLLPRRRPQILTEFAPHTFARSHTSAAFVEFLGDIIAAHPRREIHVIVDNLSAHKTKGVQEFLEAHPRVRLHFTPT
jgi:hypothetical protein